MSGKQWQKIEVIFKLKSPLHIGYLPFKGSVISPTRYYVPGRNLWGAITKRATENLFDNPEAKNYKDVGGAVKGNFLFSYFYLYDGKTVYMPRYTDKGLMFGDEYPWKFEYKFIGGRVLTAIDGSSGTAKDESLHEIEFINDKFRDENGNIKNTRLIGCIWVKKGCKLPDSNGEEVKVEKNGISMDGFSLIEELILGGESKYGFGQVLFDSVCNGKFPIEIENGSSEEIKVKINQDLPLIAHLKYNKEITFKGDIELLTGRGYFDPKRINTSKNSDNGKSNSPGGMISRSEHYFIPGTMLVSISEITGILNWDGTLVAC